MTTKGYKPIIYTTVGIWATQIGLKGFLRSINRNGSESNEVWVPPGEIE